MNYADYYYRQTVGCYPADDDTCLIQTKKTIDYLFDCGFSEQEVLKVLEEAEPAASLTPDLLPDWLWEGSLIERGKFYYHRILHIKPEAPVYNPRTGEVKTTPFYLEMKIRFTMDDLLDYFYDTMMTPAELVDRNKDAGAFKYMLEKYKKISFIEPLDFILSLIDYTKETEAVPTSSVLDTQKHEREVYDLLKQKTEEAKAAKMNRIVWR